MKTNIHQDPAAMKAALNRNVADAVAQYRYAMAQQETERLQARHNRLLALIGLAALTVMSLAAALFSSWLILIAIAAGAAFAAVAKEAVTAKQIPSETLDFSKLLSSAQMLEFDKVARDNPHLDLLPMTPRGVFGADLAYALQMAKAQDKKEEVQPVVISPFVIA